MDNIIYIIINHQFLLYQISLIFIFVGILIVIVANPKNNQNYHMIKACLIILSPIVIFIYFARNLFESYSGEILSSFFGAMGGAVIIWSVSYIKNIKDNYDNVNYAILLLSHNTENFVNFITSCVEPRIKRMVEVESQINNLENNIKHYKVLKTTPLIISTVSIDNIKLKIEENQKLDLSEFSKCLILEDINLDNLNLDKL